MGLAERSLRTTSDGRVTSRHRLARRGTYGTDPEDANATASHRVDAPAGLEAYWDGLETTFKGKISGVGCMIGVSPNEHFACAGADHGLCGPKTWTRSRDATAAQRLELLDAFQLARVQAYRIGKLDARAGADEDADEDEDEPRAAARAASLKPEVPSVSALERLANRTGLDVNRVRAFHSADQRRVQEYLVSEGTVSREEVDAAELERETRRKEKSERRRAEEERRKRNRIVSRPGRLESVGPSVAGAPSTSGFAPSPGALALVSEPAPSRGNENRPTPTRFFWSPKSDAELVFAVVRSLITRGPENTLFAGLASRGVKLPADAHRCNVRFQKHVNTGARAGLIDETVARFAERGVRGKVRAETGDDDAANARESANRWDAEGVWCESVDAELKETVREMLKAHPPAYKGRRSRGAYDSESDSADRVPLGRLARSESDSDDGDEVPLANLVRDSDSDSDEDGSDSDSDEEEVGSRAAKRARRGDAPLAARVRRDFTDEPPESRVAFANALELVKMLVMHRVDHPEDVAGKRALREMMVAVGEDAMQRAIETLRRAGMLVARRRRARIARRAFLPNRRRSSRRRGRRRRRRRRRRGRFTRGVHARSNVAVRATERGADARASLRRRARARVALTRGRGERRDPPADVPRRRGRARGGDVRRTPHGRRERNPRSRRRARIHRRAWRTPMDADGSDGRRWTRERTGRLRFLLPRRWTRLRRGRGGGGARRGSGGAPRPNSRRARARASRRARRRCARRATRETRRR